MKLPLLAILAAATSIAAVSAAESPTPAAKEKAGPVNWLWRHVPKFGGKDKQAAGWNDLRLTLTLNPAKVKLADIKRVEVALQLTNAGKKLVQLEFPTSQRIDVLVKNSAGRVIERWSEDQPIANEPTVVTINPGERLEYTAGISTREMAVGQRYTVEAFFPRYEQLRSTTTIAAE
jgi:hypothetical protein